MRLIIKLLVAEKMQNTAVLPTAVTYICKSAEPHLGDISDLKFYGNSKTSWWGMFWALLTPQVGIFHDIV